MNHCIDCATEIEPRKKLCAQHRRARRLATYRRTNMNRELRNPSRWPETATKRHACPVPGCGLVCRSSGLLWHLARHHSLNRAQSLATYPALITQVSIPRATEAQVRSARAKIREWNKRTQSDAS